MAVLLLPAVPPSHGDEAEHRRLLAAAANLLRERFIEGHFYKGEDVASAAALTLPGDGNYFDITGTTTITSMATKAAGTVVRLHFDGALTLTHHATNLILPGAANITTAAGDEAEFVEYAEGSWRCTRYQEASGGAIGISRKNFVINGGADVMQVGAYTLVKDVYGHGPDMFMGMATGTAVSAGTFDRAAGTIGSANARACHFSGITLTGSGIVYCRTRIEASDARYLKNLTATLSCLVRHDVGSNVNFTLYVRKADVADTFSAVTEIGNSGTTAVATGTDTRLTFTVAMGDCSNGIELEIKAETGAVTTKNVYIAEVQLENGATRTGFERSPASLVESLCERYFQRFTLTGNCIFASGWCASTTIARGYMKFKRTMRTTPSAAFSAGDTFEVAHQVANTAGTAVAADVLRKDQGQFSVTVAAGLTAGEGAGLRSGDGDTATVDLDARLL